MKRRVNVRTIRKLNWLHEQAVRAMNQVGEVAEATRATLGVKQDDQNAKDHIMDFCSGGVTPGELLQRLGIAVVGRSAGAEAGTHG